MIGFSEMAIFWADIEIRVFNLTVTSSTACLLSQPPLSITLQHCILWILLRGWFCFLLGGRKRSSFYYDIWNIKYLSKFKWDDLISEIGIVKPLDHSVFCTAILAYYFCLSDLWSPNAAERNHIREEKLNLEISAAKRERDFYLSKVEKSIALKHMQERRKKVCMLYPLLDIVALFYSLVISWFIAELYLKSNILVLLRRHINYSICHRDLFFLLFICRTRKKNQCSYL